MEQVWHYGYLTWMGISKKVQRVGVGKLLFCAFHDMVMKQVGTIARVSLMLRAQT